MLALCCAESSAAPPLLWGIVPGSSSEPFPQLTQDVAAFLLLRGPYAYIGYGVWGMSWPVGTSFTNSTGPVAGLPQLLKDDYGTPLGTCVGVKNVFTRQWSKANVTLDCNVFEGSIVFH